MTNYRTEPLVKMVETLEDDKKGIIFFTDFHAHLFEEFAQPTGDDFVNTRFQAQVETLQSIYELAEATKQKVICGGDLFHKRGSVSTTVFNGIFEVIASHTSVPTLIVRGNHDSVNNSLYSDSALKPLGMLPNVTLSLVPEIVDFHGTSVACLPYGDEIDEMKQFIKDAPPCDLLVAHIGVEGATECSGHSLAGAFTTGDLLADKFNNVLLGHYHKRQELAKGILYGGNTVPMNFGDVGSKGIHVLNPKMKHQSPVYLEIQNPEFVTITPDTTLETEVIQEVMNSDFVRLQGNTEMVNKLVALDEVPTNIRVEVKETFDVESRIGISATSTPQEVVSAYCKEFAPACEETALEYINRTLKERA